MIKLEKLEEPELLKEKKEEWLKEYLTACQSNSLTNTIQCRYKEKPIKAHIKKETFGKCAYCETKILSSSHGDVEHILPKSKFSKLIFTWTNLTLACSVCNINKGDYYSDELPLINPYQNNPEDFLMAVGPLVFQIPANKIGETTVRRLNLNRMELVEVRKERIDSLMNLVTRYIEEDSKELKELLLDELKKEIGSEKKYVFISKVFLKDKINLPIT